MSHLSINVLFFEERGLWARLIRWWTKAPFAHVEVAFDGDLRLKVVAGQTITMSYGGRKPQAAAVIPVSWDEYRQAFIAATHLVGCAYDWQGIFGQVAGKITQKYTEHPGRWFCSEAAAKILLEIGKLPAGQPQEWYSPGRLAQALGVSHHQ